MFSFFRINTYTKLHKIGTLQYSSHIYCQFQTVFSAQIIIHVLYLMSQLKIYSKRKIASKMLNLEHKCVLQESCKTVRLWQRFILLVKGVHCVGDCEPLCISGISHPFTLNL